MNFDINKTGRTVPEDNQRIASPEIAAQIDEAAKAGRIVMPSSEPVARLAFVDAIQSAITDLVQQYELIRMYDGANPAPTLSAAELVQVLGDLGIRITRRT